MVNQYRRGRRAEIEVADELRRCGYDVVLSSVSKGAADIVAWNDHERLLIQVKTGKPGPIPPAERVELTRMARRMEATPVTAHREPGAGARPALIRWRELTDTGPAHWVNWVPVGATV